MDSKEYYKNNKEKILEHNKEYYLKNFEKIKKQRHQHYLKNKERILKRNLNNRLKNKEKYRIYANMYNKEYRHRKYVKEKREMSDLKRNYGLSKEEYLKMSKNQNGVCAICKGKCYGNRRLYVDHNHINGKIRGLLCNNCNSGIGMLKDSIELLLVAIEYLKKYQ
ncbi:MAG: endonuclease domain-containing protein [Candidatus Sericytochromatia bacterium]